MFSYFNPLFYSFLMQGSLELPYHADSLRVAKGQGDTSYAVQQFQPFPTIMQPPHTSIVEVTAHVGVFERTLRRCLVACC